MKVTSILFLLLISSVTSAQGILSLQECYDLAEENYPLASQISLLEEKTAHEIEVIQKDYLPKIELNGKATYQSDVIEIPLKFDGQTINSVDKDQYRASLDVEQLIFNGGKIDAKKELIRAELLSRSQQVKVSLYEIKKMINKYYFGILELREKKALLISKEDALEERLQEMESLVRYGAALAASEEVLKAEILKIKQQQDEVESSLHKALKTLSLYIAIPVETST
ncbi:MAG: TolC family protein, partial [Salinimicrobium sp.]